MKNETSALEAIKLVGQLNFLDSVERRSAVLNHEK
jgi:hypothetical protein